MIGRFPDEFPTRSLVVPPELSEMEQARTFLEDVGREAGLSRQRTYDLIVAVSEALANSIEHPEVPGDVALTAHILPDRVELEVVGPGAFKQSKLGEPSRHRGFGLFLMAGLADELLVRAAPSGGTAVRLSFLRDAEPLPEEAPVGTALRPEDENLLLISILAAAPLGIFALTPALSFRWVNPAFRDLLPPPRSAMNLGGLPLVDALPGVRESGVLRALGRVSERGETFGAEERRHATPGGFRYWDWHALPLLSTFSEAPYDVLVLVRDVTDQVLARQELEALLGELGAAGEEAEWVLGQVIRRRGELETITGGAGAGLLVWDRRGTLLEVNGAALGMLGLDGLAGARPYLYDPSGLEFYSLEGREVAPEFSPFARASAGEAFAPVDLQVFNAVTGEVWVGRYECKTLRDDRGEVLLSVLRITDVTGEPRAAPGTVG